MKVLGSIISLFIFALFGSGQALPDESSQLKVIKHEWSLEERNHALESDPLKPVIEREQEDLAQRREARQAAARAREGVVVLQVPRARVPTPEMPAAETGRQGVSVAYVYKLTVNNIGPKRIRTIIWDYVFFEHGTTRVVGRLRFTSDVRIGPGKTRKVVVRSKSPPTGTIDAARIGKKEREHHLEQVVIQRIA